MERNALRRISTVTHNDDREEIELYVSCRNLRNMDTFSKTDP